MDLNRNQFFMLGLIIFLLGLQFRLTDSIVLTPKATKFLAQRTGHQMAAAIEVAGQFSATDETMTASTTIIPPDWLAWSVLATGAVLILHSLAMPRPD